MMASNPAVKDVNLVLFSLVNISRQLAGGPPLPTHRSFFEWLPFGLRNSMSVYAREMHKAAHGHQQTSQFVGMAGWHRDSVHDLLGYEDPLSDSSSAGDNNLERVSAPPRVCAMAGPLLTLLRAPIYVPQAHRSCSFSFRVFPQGLSIHGTSILLCLTKH
jgi:hypothetical protein